MSNGEASVPEMESAVDPQVATILRCLAPEEIDMLRDAFIYMDRDSDGFVSLDEMLRKVEASVPEERYGPLREYLTPLFRVADKDADGKLSLTEFLMSFADGPGVVPADVVNTCVSAVRVRLTDEEISALQENFHRMDTDADGLLNPSELEAALREHLHAKFPDLTDEQFREIVSVIMESADVDGDGKLCLSEFIRSFQEDQGVLPASFVDTSVLRNAGSSPAVRELSAEEANVLREAFAVLDKNSDGYIDFVDLYNALWESLSGQVEDSTQIRELCDLIMATADRRGKGRLSLSEFVLGFLRNMEVMQIPIAVAQEKVNNACGKLQSMFKSGELQRLVTAFEGLDHDGDGYIDRAELVSVLVSLFAEAFPEWSSDTLHTVMTAIVTGAEAHESGRLSLEEFIRSFVDGAGVLPLEALALLENRQQPHSSRPGTASDADLQRISEALRSVSALTDEDNCIAESDLRRAIYDAFATGSEASAKKADEMVRYVLSRYLDTAGDGRLAWNANVQFEEADADAESPKDGAAVRVPTTQKEEPTQDAQQVPTNNVDEDTDVQFTNREGSAPPPRSASLSGSVRRRMVRASSVEVEPVTSVFDRASSAQAPQAADERVGGNEAAAHTAADTAPQDEAAVRQPQAGTVAVRKPTRPSSLASELTAALISKENHYVDSWWMSGQQSQRSNGAASYRNGLPDAAAASGQSNADGAFDGELRELFKRYDKDKNGYLDRRQFKAVYAEMEHYGLEPSPQEMDRLFSKYSNGSDKIFYDEFCVLMLQRVQM